MLPRFGGRPNFGGTEPQFMLGGANLLYCRVHSGQANPDVVGVLVVVVSLRGLR